MPSSQGRQKVQSAYQRFLQKNTWAAICYLKPELQGTNPDFYEMSVKKVWDFIDRIIDENSMDQTEINKHTRFI